MVNVLIINFGVDYFDISYVVGKKTGIALRESGPHEQIFLKFIQENFTYWLRIL